MSDASGSEYFSYDPNTSTLHELQTEQDIVERRITQQNTTVTSAKLVKWFGGICTVGDAYVVLHHGPESSTLVGLGCAVVAASAGYLAERVFQPELDKLEKESTAITARIDRHLGIEE